MVIGNIGTLNHLSAYHSKGGVMLKSEQKRREIKKMVKKLSEKLAKKMALDFQINKSRFTMVEEPKKK